MKRFGLLSILVCCFCLPTNAQFADSLRSQFLKDWQRSKLYTLDYLKTMPEDKYAFRPQDSVRSFAQQMIHISQGTIGLMEAATGKKVPSVINRPDLEQSISALQKDSVLFFISLSYDYAIEALQEFNMADSYQQVQRGKFKETRLAWMLKAFEHQAHHRGQTTIYLRMAGIKPPNERLFDNMYE